MLCTLNPLKCMTPSPDKATSKESPNPSCLSYNGIDRPGANGFTAFSSFPKTRGGKTRLAFPRLHSEVKEKSFECWDVIVAFSLTNYFSKQFF